MAENKTSSKCPAARSKDLLIEEIAGELLVYDVARDRAHCLNPSAAAIWKHCDGNRSTHDLASHLFPSLSRKEGEQLVGLGIERLRRRRLLQEAEGGSPVDLSRRDLVKRIATVAAAAGIMAPLVSSIVAPTPARAVSCAGMGGACVTSVECCTGLVCFGTQCL
jgi:hypothetical protein